MKPISFTAGGMLAGVANMLELLDFDTSDREIALGMEVPYLFVKDDRCYRAGAGLYHPTWLNLYLNSHGFNMTKETIAKDEVPAYLRKHTPVMLSMTISGRNRHPVVFSGYSEGRYHFVNIKSRHCNEPDFISLTSTTLKRHLADAVTVYTIDACDPKAVDYIPLLLASLNALDAYQADILAACQLTVTRAEFTNLETPLFRAIMKDLHPIMTLIDAPVLTEELRMLNHDYRHVFTENDGDSIALSERLPKHSIKLCISWLREHIIDRLYELGADEGIIEAAVNSQY